MTYRRCVVVVIIIVAHVCVFVCMCVCIVRRRPYRVLCQLGEAISEGSEPYPLLLFLGFLPFISSHSHTNDRSVYTSFSSTKQRTPATKSSSPSQSVQVQSILTPHGLKSVRTLHPTFRPETISADLHDVSKAKRILSTYKSNLLYMYIYYIHNVKGNTRLPVKTVFVLYIYIWYSSVYSCSTLQVLDDILERSETRYRACNRKMAWIVSKVYFFSKNYGFPIVVKSTNHRTVVIVYASNTTQISKVITLK